MVRHAIFLCFFCFALPVAASPLPSRGAVTEAQIALATAAQNSCESSITSRTHYDCTCVGAQTLETLRRFRQDKLSFTEEEQVRNLCLNKTDVAGEMFTRCMGWGMLAPKTQKNFCECYANEYANDFGKSRTQSDTHREEMMTRALNKCNLSTAITQ
jgi:hypothetical protein